MAAGFLALAQLDASSGYLAFMGGLLIFGVGMALAGTPATTAIVSSLPVAKQGVASAMNDTTREIGSALGIAILGSMYATGYHDSIDGATTELPADAAHAVSESAAAGLQVASQVPGEAGGQLAHSVRVAFMDGLSTSLTIGALVVIAAAAIIAWIGPRRTPTTVTETTDHIDAATPELALVDA